MNTKSVLQSIGVQIKPTDRYDFSALAGKKNYGQLFENPSFVGFEQLTKAADKIPLAEVVEPHHQRDIDFRGRKWVVEDEKWISAITPRFNLFQNRELMMHVVEAARQFDLEPIGHVRNKLGVMTGHMVFVGAEQQIELLKDTGEDIATGIRWSNGYGGRGLHLETMGIRTICVNYNAWGQSGVNIRVGHNSPNLQEKIEKAFRDFVERTGDLPAVINKAKDTPINHEDITDILWGTGFPASGIAGKRKKNALVPNLEAWEPSITTNGLSAWTLYEAGTAYLTHGTTMNPDGVEYHTNKLAQILRKSPDELAARGRKLREKQEQRLAEEDLAVTV